MKPPDPAVVKQWEEIIAQATAEVDPSRDPRARITVDMDIASLLAVASNLQLALASPDNQGAAARCVSAVLDGMIESVRATELYPNCVRYLEIGRQDLRIYEVLLKDDNLTSEVVH
jgi:hypothetical protein